MNIIMRTLRIYLAALLLASTLFGQSKARFEQPILITSAGQSADVTLVSMLCKKLSLKAKAIPMAKISDLADAKTLVIVAGFSSKGLGAAGISREQELDRVKDIIEAAKKQKTPILMMHIGGKPRRGTQSDEFNQIAAQAADRMLVVKQGDEDKFFSDIAAKNKTSIDIIEKIVDAQKPLADYFQSSQNTGSK